MLEEYIFRSRNYEVKYMHLNGSVEASGSEVETIQTDGRPSKTFIKEKRGRKIVSDSRERTTSMAVPNIIGSSVGSSSCWESMLRACVTMKCCLK